MSNYGTQNNFQYGMENDVEVTNDVENQNHNENWQNPSEVIANGMHFSFFVPVEECQDIERFVDEYIKVNLDESVTITGKLLRVSTWKKKEKGEVIGIYKQINLQVEAIDTTSDMHFSFPDKKEIFEDTIRIQYSK